MLIPKKVWKKSRLFLSSSLILLVILVASFMSLHLIGDNIEKERYSKSFNVLKSHQDQICEIIDLIETLRVVKIDFFESESFATDSLSMARVAIENWKRKIRSGEFQKWGISQKKVQQANALLDSISLLEVKFDSITNAGKVSIPRFNRTKILESVEIESTITIDTVPKRGLFKRVANAFTGNIDVQKDVIQTKVKMNFKNSIQERTVYETIEYLLDQIENNNKKNQEVEKRNTANRIELNKKAISLYLKFNNILLEEVTNKLAQFYNQENDLNLFEIEVQRKNYTVNYSILVISLIVIGLVLFTLLAIIAYGNMMEEKLEISNRQIETQNQNNQKLLEKLSHEVRSPLSIIGTLSNRIDKMIPDGMASQLFTHLSYSISSTLELVDHMMIYLRSQKKELSPSNIKTNLYEETKVLLGSIDVLIHQKGNQLTVQNKIPKGLDVEIDRILFRQLLFNTVGNSNKYVNNGNINVTLDCKRVEEGLVNLSIQIVDTGPGISQELIHQINSDFKFIALEKYRGDLYSLGIGISICKEIVAQYDGFIKVSNVNQEGGLRTNIELNLKEITHEKENQ